MKQKKLNRNSSMPMQQMCAYSKIFLSLTHTHNNTTLSLLLSSFIFSLSLASHPGIIIRKVKVMTHKVLPEEVWGGLLPKKETQSFDFIQNHPDWDGRGIIVGILDTGVDPGAIGLQQTTDGKPKVIDIIDCSGSGDVTMHGPFQVDSEGTLPGIGGQRLKVNTTWNNPSGEFRVGVKVGSLLFCNVSLV